MEKKDKKDGVILTAAALLLVIMLVLVVIQVVFRYISDNPVAQTDELSRYAMVWAALLGAALGIKDNSHVAVTILTDMLPQKIKKAVHFFVSLAIIGFCAILVWQGSLLVQISMRQVSTTLGIKMGYIVAIVPLTGLLGLIFAIKNCVKR